MVDNNEKKDFLSMGDEEFLQINPSTTENSDPIKDQSSTVNEEEKNKTEVIEEKETNNSSNNEEDELDKSEPVKEDKAEEAKSKDTGWKEYVSDKNKSDEENATAKAEHDKTKPSDKEGKESDKDTEKNPDGTDKVKTDSTQVEDKTKPVDYENFYKQIMTPFKANGKEIKLNSPEEAIRLMQMGAGYGKRLQELQPHLKTIRMLEKNNLLDENQLSFLIDISKKNPEAIKKLVKDSGIDPLDLNTNDDVGYKPTNHSVSDSEINFQTALQDVISSPGGQETVKEINSKWDKVSKQALWESPEILGVIQSQRELGIYDQINAEIDRQKLLGHIPPNTPFLQAYKTAGDYLTSNNLLKLPESSAQHNKAQDAKPDPVVIATRTAPVKSEVVNSDKANAAAPTKATSRKASEIKNPLEMADEDFIKQFNGRL